MLTHATKPSPEGTRSSSLEPIRRKPLTGPVNDSFERQAEAIADRVIRTTTRPSGHDFGRIPVLDEQGASPHGNPRPAGDGAPIPVEVRRPLEAGIGFDFAGVRIHSGPGAAEAARSIHARAYSVGRDVVFAHGAPSFDSSDGLRLLAHELVHVVQQGAAAVLDGAAAFGATSGNALSASAPAGRAQRQVDVAAIDVEIAEIERQVMAAQDPAELGRLHERRNELLAERRQATQPSAGGGVSERPSEGAAPQVRTGFRMADYDRQTHWGSEEQRRRWIVENLPRAVFDSQEERARYEALAHGPAGPGVDPALAAYLGVSPPAGSRQAPPFVPQPSPGFPNREREVPRPPRLVPVHQFTPTTFMGPTLELGTGYRVQTRPDRTGGYNFDTYLYNSRTGQLIPAYHLGGTRYRVLMGSEQCPGCHFGQGLEVDLHGQHFLMVAGPMILSGLGAMGSMGRAPGGGGPSAPPPSLGAGGAQRIAPVIPLRVPAPVVNPPVAPAAAPYAFAGNRALNLAPQPAPLLAPAARPLAQVIPLPRPFTPPVAAPAALTPWANPSVPGLLAVPPLMQPYAGVRDHRRRQQAPVTLIPGVDYEPAEDEAQRNPCDHYRVPTCASLRGSGMNYAFSNTQQALGNAILGLPVDRRGQSFISRGSEESASDRSPCSAANSDRPGTHDTFWSADDRTKITIVCCPCCEPAADSPIPGFPTLCAVHNIEQY